MWTQELLAAAAEVGERLRDRGETVAVAESSAGGLISAALLAVPGASAYFRGGGVVYTTAAKHALIGMSDAALGRSRPATEGHALELARAARAALETDWAIGETGAAGPTGNRYGDPAGHASLGVAGPREGSTTVSTGREDRAENMVAFAVAALRLLGEHLEA